MAEIKCPNCGTVISLEQSDLDSVVRQVRDEEFARELAVRTATFKTELKQAVQLAKSETKSESKDTIALKDAEIAELRSQLALQAAQLKASAKEQAVEAQAAMEAKLAELQSQLDANEQKHAVEKELAVTRAVAKAEKERDRLQAALEAKDLEKATLEARMSKKLTEEVEARDALIRVHAEELERLKDMRSRLSTKLIGESLEQHCQDAFNRIRAAAFPNAYFEKDTETVAGTKGDFIFREEDGQGNEIISIMFEMKNEGDTDSRKTKNSDHLAKLDKDRTNKKCEYAVLVSLLEPESELYNEGIVDLSYRYPKMYVIRPQFFIPMISLLRNAALNALEYKQEAALMRQQNIDITTFESEIEAFKKGFFRNYELASNRFGDAIKDIDRTIDILTKIRDNLTKSERHLEAANNKLDGLTVKKLTRKNPTVRAMFEALHEEEGQRTPDNEA